MSTAQQKVHSLFPPFPGVSVAETYDETSSVVLFHGDCMELIGEIADESVALVITSPPYNLGKDYEKTRSLDEYLATYDSVIDGLCRVLRPNGSICWQVGNYVNKGEVFPLDMQFYPLFKRRGLQLRNRIIWRFGHGLHTQRRFSGRYETLLWFTKGADYVFNLDEVRVASKYPGKRYFKGARKGQISGNPQGKNPSDMWEVMAEDWEAGIWDIPNVKANHCEKTDHPCQYPVELAERCVLAFTREDDVVLDPYCGVGTTAIAAVRHSRRAVVSDIEPGYIRTARERLKQLLEGTLPVRPMGKPVYEPSGHERIAQVPIEWGNDSSADGT